MLTALRTHLVQAIAGLAILAALLTLGLAHRPVMGGAVNPTILLAAADYCGDVPAGGDHVTRGCEACRITSGCMVPPDPRGIGPAPVLAPLRRAIAHDTVMPAVRDGGPPPVRAPPRA